LVRVDALFSEVPSPSLAGERVRVRGDLNEQHGSERLDAHPGQGE
jgi:hypothetical protein